MASDLKYDGRYIQLRFQQAAVAETILEKISSSEGIVENIKYQYETYDGKGPFMLEGEEIPLGARIIHIASLYYEISKALSNESLDKILMEFVSKGHTYLDTRLTSLFVKKLKNPEQ